MKYFTFPNLFLHKLVIIGTTLGLLLGCSSADKDIETLAQTSDNYTLTQKKEPIDPAASRNNGAWGSVYITETELKNQNRNIVDSSMIPAYDSDPDLTQWQQKFGVDGNVFSSTNGEKLYHDSCAGCHMHDGKGAFGAGYYPPLANNSKMESKYYILDILINGFRGMPSFADEMNDEQLASVTQYVMHDLNGYATQVSLADAAQLRPKIAPELDKR